jgi:hypothetical protein
MRRTRCESDIFNPFDHPCFCHRTKNQARGKTHFANIGELIETLTTEITTNTPSTVKNGNRAGMRSSVAALQMENTGTAIGEQSTNSNAQAHLSLDFHADIRETTKTDRTIHIHITSIAAGIEYVLTTGLSSNAMAPVALWITAAV